MSRESNGLVVRIVMESLDPPSGHGSLDGESPWRFTGWLELMEKVEQLRSHDEDRSGERAHREGGVGDPHRGVG